MPKDKDKPREVGVLGILWGVVDKALRILHVSASARVVEYDRVTRRATVQPQIRERFADGQVRERTPIASRPVVLPRGGGFGLWFDLSKNDPCVTLVADETTAGYWETGQETTPVFGQRHQPSDAVVLPGGVPDPEQLPVNGVGELVLGTPSLTEALILKGGDGASPSAVGKAEIRVTVRLDLGGVNGLAGARSTDPVEPDANFTSIMSRVFTAANTLGAAITPVEIGLFETAMGKIKDRPAAKVFVE